jgi:modulator of FtsH protease
VPGWDQFFAAGAESAATLTGLLFVAVSINLSRILAVPRLPGRAGETLLVLTSPIVICLVALIPGAGPAAVGGSWLAIGAFVASAAVLIQSRGPRNADEPRAVRGFLSFGPALAIALGGALVLERASAGLDVEAGAVIACLVCGVFNAWVLLVEIMR